MPKDFISNERWVLLRERVTAVGIKKTKNLRQTLNGILWKIKNGCPWGVIPSKFGKKSTIYSRYNEWCRNGKFKALFDILGDALHIQDASVVQMDATTVRAHQHGASKENREIAAIGRSKGGLTTKISVLLGKYDLPIGFVLAAGNRNDIESAPTLVSKLGKNTMYLLADKGYDSSDLRDRILAIGVTPIIPIRSTTKPRANQFMDRVLYKTRYKIENFFAHLKQYRGIATRYDRLARNFAGAIYIVCIAKMLGLLVAERGRL